MTTTAKNTLKIAKKLVSLRNRRILSAEYLALHKAFIKAIHKVKDLNDKRTILKVAIG